MISVTAIVVAYGPEPWLQRCVDAVLASTGIEIDVVVVDNGDTSGVVDRLVNLVDVHVVRPGRNTGFAGGCNAGAAVAGGDVLALVNPDVIVEPDALAHLASAVGEARVGIATASVRLGDRPQIVNSVGNPVHYLGLAWAGGHDDPASRHTARRSVASASGACSAIRRSLWESLGGFNEDYFAYHEDVELSLRSWQRGFEVVYVPRAVALHHYEFGRNAFKYELLERNRWLTVLTLYSGRMLALVAPALLTVEILLLGAAAAQGWLPAKLAGYRWLITHAASIRRRRAALQGQRTRSDRQLAWLFAARFEPTNLGALPGLSILNAALAGYWSVVRRFL